MHALRFICSLGWVFSSVAGVETKWIVNGVQSLGMGLQIGRM
jgi:hypothetical protein